MKHVYIPPMIALPIVFVVAVAATTLVLHTISVISNTTPAVLADTPSE